MKLKFLALCLIALCNTYGDAPMQIGFVSADGPGSPFYWTGAFSKDTCSPGDMVTLRMKLHIAKEHYAYKAMTYVQPSPQTKGVAFGSVWYSEPVTLHEEVTDSDKLVFVDSMAVSIEMQILPDVFHETDVVIFVAHQGCKGTMCFMPYRNYMHFRLIVPGGKEKGRTITRISEEGGGLADKIKAGGLFALIAALIAGFLTSFTPCVYPLIPITIGIFSAGGVKSRVRTFILSLVYVSGIAVMFSLLGFIAASTGSVFGQFMSNPWVIGFVALIFCVFGISLFGAFDFRLPSSVITKLSSVSGTGYRRTFLMGLVGGIVAAPCTGPSLGAILAIAAVSGSKGFGLLLLLIYAFGLGIPFIVLATFSGLLSSRPRPGVWMDGVKSFLGIAMFVAALYFLRGAFPSIDNLFSKSKIYLVSMIICAAAGIVLGGVHLSFSNAGFAIRLRKIVGIFLTIIGIFGIIGNMFLAKEPSAESKTTWLRSIDEGLKKARAENLPVMVDFYADWCAACKELDKITFSDPKVSALLKKIVCVRINLSETNEENDRLAKQYNIIGLPTVIFYDGAGNVLDDKKITGFMSPERFLGHISDIAGSESAK